MSRVFIVAALVIVAAPARADKSAQATGLWRTHCANCHVVGRGRAARGPTQSYVDLTLTTRAHDDEWLKQWILSPQAIKPDTRCFTAGLDVRAIDLLIAFLRTHARPPVSHAVAPARWKAPLPPPAPPEPPKGAVRGR